jgi:hypothetical protein
VALRRIPHRLTLPFRSRKNTADAMLGYERGGKEARGFGKLPGHYAQEEQEE